MALHTEATGGHMGNYHYYQGWDVTPSQGHSQQYMSLVPIYTAVWRRQCEYSVLSKTTQSKDQALNQWPPDCLIKTESDRKTNRLTTTPLLFNGGIWYKRVKKENKQTNRKAWQKKIKEHAKEQSNFTKDQNNNIANKNKKMAISKYLSCPLCDDIGEIHANNKGKKNKTFWI